MKTDRHKSKEELTSESGEVRYLLMDAEASVSGLKFAKVEAQGALIYAEDIIQTMREPLLVLDADLKILSSQPFLLCHLSSKAGRNRRKLYL